MEKLKKLEKTSLNDKCLEWDYLHLTALMKETYFIRDFITDSASSQFKIRHSKDSKNHLIHSSENRTGGDHLNLLGKVFFPPSSQKW